MLVQRGRRALFRGVAATATRAPFALVGNGGGVCLMPQRTGKHSQAKRLEYRGGGAGQARFAGDCHRAPRIIRAAGSPPLHRAKGAQRMCVPSV